MRATKVVVTLYAADRPDKRATETVRSVESINFGAAELSMTGKHGVYRRPLSEIVAVQVIA